MCELIRTDNSKVIAELLLKIEALQTGLSVPPMEEIIKYAEEADPNGEDLCGWSFRKGFEAAIEYANQLRQQPRG